MKRIAVGAEKHQQALIVYFEQDQTSFDCMTEGMMVSAGLMTEQNPAAHAVAGDYCRIFQQNMNGLYLLSLLLTADRTIAEQCFVDGLEDSANSSRVFKGWAHSWARRMIVQNAIHMIGPRPGGGDAPAPDAARVITDPAEVSAILELPAFERFVFVMSVLERYSEQDCALLLDCTYSEVSAARLRALQLIGSSAEEHCRSAATGADGGEQGPRKAAALALKLESVPHLAALA